MLCLRCQHASAPIYPLPYAPMKRQASQPRSTSPMQGLATCACAEFGGENSYMLAQPGVDVLLRSKDMRASSSSTAMFSATLGEKPSL
mmetsp:Transcript_1582/g.2388  ORF Transcript_1582/g.2388 Transcript_1582/m.2388 type:complete len:88 (+) Transcript_1582:202-465(+)